MSRSALYIHSLGTVSAAGIGLQQLRQTLFGQRSSAMRFHNGLAPDPNKAFFCGFLSDLKPTNDSNRTALLLELCLKQMPELHELLRTVAPDRVAVVLGACTSGMHCIEEDMSEYVRTQQLPKNFSIRNLNLFEPARFVADKIGALGPVYTVSNACASGLLALESAAQLLCADLADLVIAGGCDGFCQFTNAGFSALSAVSSEPCTPFAESRKGINLGEGGALVAMSRQASEALLAYGGAGLTTDAHHLSAPEPEGIQAAEAMRLAEPEGIQAAEAMRLALVAAGIAPTDVDLVLAHGTGTPLNDSMEAKAIEAVFGSTTPCASYKALSGHTLAGAGALQAAIAAALLTDNPDGVLPPSAGIEATDPALAPAHVLTQTRVLGREIRHIVANAFAFGGSNASAVFSRVSP